MKSFRNFILQAVLYILLGVLSFWLYKVFAEYYNSPMPSLSNADIPQETIDWFKRMIDGGSDIGGIMGPDERNPADWSHYEDIDSMLRLEDEYFVIFYSAKDSVVERKKAVISQRYAHNAIPMGEQLMKGYPYPSQLNGRKLPIYLARTVDNFRSICQQIGHGDPGTWAIGLYCFQYSVSGVYTDGIIISPKAWSVSGSQLETDSEDRELKKTLWHEMNHFMYFTNWNYTQTSRPYLWFTEGLAEYFSGTYNRLISVANHKSFNLQNDFIDGNSEYWVGMTAFLCLERLYGKSTVYDVVSNSYKNSINEAVQMSIQNESLNTWNTNWHSFMNNNTYREYLDF